MLKKMPPILTLFFILCSFAAFVPHTSFYFCELEVAHDHFAKTTGLEEEQLNIKKRYADTLAKVRDWYEKRIPACGNGLKSSEKESAKHLEDSLYAIFDGIVADYQLRTELFKKNVLPHYEAIITDSINTSFARFRKKWQGKEIVLLTKDSIGKLNLSGKEFTKYNYTKNYLGFLASH